jgi:hypothetical protein
VCSAFDPTFSEANTTPATHFPFPGIGPLWRSFKKKRCVKSVKSVKSPLAMREVAFATPYPILSICRVRGRSLAGLMGAVGGTCASEAP